MGKKKGIVGRIIDNKEERRDVQKQVKRNKIRLLPFKIQGRREWKEYRWKGKKSKNNIKRKMAAKKEKDLKKGDGRSEGKI